MEVKGFLIVLLILLFLNLVSAGPIKGSFTITAESIEEGNVNYSLNETQEPSEDFFDPIKDFFISIWEFLTK